MNLPETDKDYYLLVNKVEIKNKAEELGYDNVVFITDDGLSDSDIQEIKATGKGISMNLFPYPSEFEKELKELLNNADIRHKGSSYTVLDEDEYETWNPATDIKCVEDALPRIPMPEDLEFTLLVRNIIKTRSYKNRCGNCREHMDDNDKFCKFCGFRKGSGTFEPFYDSARIAYGPPAEIKYTCSSCGFTWIHNGFPILGEPHYCPECGKDTFKCTEYRALF